MMENDQRADLAAWEIAERPFKIWLQGWFVAMEEYCKKEDVAVPKQYAKHLRMMKLAKTLAKRMDHKSLLKIPDQSGEVTMEQTPNEENTRPWVIKLDVVDKDYRMDVDAAKKFASILTEIDQPRAEYQFRISLGSVYSSVMQVYDGMRYYNPDLLSNVALLMNEKFGIYGVVSAELPNFHYDKFLGVVIQQVESF